MFGEAGVSPTNEQLQEIRNRLPAQVHDYLDLRTFFFFLNTQLRPFNDIRVRQAINFAVKRNKALEAYHQQGRVTCQILPPNFLGYRPFCPYGLDPNSRYGGNLCALVYPAHCLNHPAFPGGSDS